MGAAILSSISGIFSTAGGVWSGFNSLKSQKLEISKLEQQSQTELDLASKQILLKALEIKKEELTIAEAAAKSKTTLRGILILVLGSIAGIATFFYFKNKK
jgi:hypothetical protein